MQDELTGGHPLSVETQKRLEEVRISSPASGEPLAELVDEVRAQWLATKEATDEAEKQAAVEAWISAEAALRAELQSQQAALDEAWRSATAAVKLARVAAAIPAPDAVAHLGRYETMHSRELDRVMARLAELQRHIGLTTE